MSKWSKEWWKEITPKRGEIYWVNFGKLDEKDASQGTEINGKTRPAVVISNNLQNEKGRRVVIAHVYYYWRISLPLWFICWKNNQ